MLQSDLILYSFDGVQIKQMSVSNGGSMSILGAKYHVPYEQTKRVENKHNDTSYGTWYFAPIINIDPPFEIEICLIWTPSKEYKIKSDWSIAVSQFF